METNSFTLSGRTLCKALILLCGVLTLGLTSCLSPSPKNHETTQTKRWIFLKSISGDWFDSLVSDFVSEVALGNIAVSGIVSRYSIDFNEDDANFKYKFGDAALHMFEQLMQHEYFVYKHRKNADKLREEYIKSWESRINQAMKSQGSWNDWYNDAVILARDPEESDNVKTALFDKFMTYCGNIADRQVSVLNWAYEVASQADSYTGYLVTYEVGSGYFVLILLVEFDDSNRYNMEIIYKGSSMVDLNEHIEM